jgi:DNA-binding beta-propeller fold protein YncE
MRPNAAPLALHIARATLVALACGTATPPAAAQLPADLTGTIVVTNKGGASASIVDIASGRILVTLPTGDGPHEVVLSRNGEIAVVTDYGGPPRRTLTVLDVPGMRVARTIDLGQYTAPHGIVFLPGDSLVAVTSEATQNVVIVNALAGEVRTAISTGQPGSHMVAATRDASYLYTGDMGSNTVSELDARAGRRTRGWDVPTRPEAINVTPDGAEIWVGSNEEHKVSVLDPRTGAIRTVADSVAWPYRILFTPDLQLVLIPDLGNEELRFIDRSSHREIERLRFPGAAPQGITITPDGRFAFLSLSREDRIAVIDIAARSVIGHLPAGARPDGVVYTARVFAR